MRRLIIACMICMANFLSGCDSSNLDALESRLLVASNSISAIEITSPSSIIQVDGNRALTLIGTVDGATSVVTNSADWSSSDSTVITVNSAGVVTGVADGSATITAVLGPLTGSIELTASSALLETINIVIDTAVTDATIDECAGVNFTASGDFADGETGRPLTDLVAWSLSAGSIGVFDTDTDGLLRSDSAGQGTISATLDGVSGSFDLTVSDNLESITITSDGSTLSARNTVQYTATASYLDNTNTIDITDNAGWSLDATFAQVDNDLPDKGLVTATSTGTETLAVSCGGVSGSLSISSGSATEIEAFFFDPASPSNATFSGLETLQINAFIRFENGTNRDVTEEADWLEFSNTNPLNLIDDREDSKGEVTIRGPGTLVVEARFRDEDNDPPQTYTGRFTVRRDNP